MKGKCLCNFLFLYDQNVFFEGARIPQGPRGSQMHIVFPVSLLRILVVHVLLISCKRFPRKIWNLVIEAFLKHVQRKKILEASPSAVFRLDFSGILQQDYSFFSQNQKWCARRHAPANTPKAFGDCSFWLRYPNEPAAQLAIEVVSSFLQQSPDALDFIIFDTFLPKDYVVYRKLLDATLDSHWTRKVDMEGWHCGLLNPDYSKSTGRQLTNIMCVYGQRIFLI